MICDVGCPARLEGSREFTKGASLIRIGEHDLADEPVECPGSNGKSLRTCLHNGEAAILTCYKRAVVKFDADSAATPTHGLFKLGARPAAHVDYTGPGGEVGEGVIVQDIAGPRGL